ncbi:MAG: AraC family transcriptional regulator [Gallionella sp.]
MKKQSTAQNIDDFLRNIHLGSEVYYVGQLCDAWHMFTPGGDAVAFHLVCHGEAWVHMPGHARPVQMRAGDIAFFPHDAAHAFSSRQQVSPGQAFSYGTPVPFDRDAPGAGLICGHLKLPAHIRRLLLASFPEFMLIHPERSPVGRQMRSLLEMMSAEANLNELGVTAILDRFSDALFLYVIRHILHLEPGLSPLFAALSDEHLRPALAAFVENPAEQWSIERMAGIACQSRSAFSERFNNLVRMPPMEFIAAWRMQLAVGWLTNGNTSTLDVAMKCGYESEAAFRKAFKRIVGVPPGKIRSPRP